MKETKQNAPDLGASEHVGLGCGVDAEGAEQEVREEVELPLCIGWGVCVCVRMHCVCVRERYVCEVDREGEVCELVRERGGELLVCMVCMYVYQKEGRR
jgi:hypothetical protein